MQSAFEKYQWSCDFGEIELQAKCTQDLIGENTSIVLMIIAYRSCQYPSSCLQVSSGFQPNDTSKVNFYQALPIHIAANDGWSGCWFIYVKNHFDWYQSVTHNGCTARFSRASFFPNSHTSTVPGLTSCRNTCMDPTVMGVVIDMVVRDSEIPKDLIFSPSFTF